MNSKTTLNMFDDNLASKPIQETKKSFLKCPFNYIGGKYKLLPQLYSVFPKNPDIFVDLFGGGFNVGLNSDANKIYYNDQLTPLVDLFKYLQTNKKENIIKLIVKFFIIYLNI